MGGYIKHFDQILKDGDLLLNVFFGVLVFAIVGAIIGYILDSLNARK
jgi:uncharacterized membrane protein